jgi:hypothetical protein
MRYLHLKDLQSSLADVFDCATIDLIDLPSSTHITTPGTNIIHEYLEINLFRLSSLFDEMFNIFILHGSRAVLLL